MVKAPRIATLVPSMPDQPSFTFQFKRKKLYIEKIHLPPDLSILEETAHDHAQSAKSGGAAEVLCATGPSKSSSLDF